MTPLERLLDKIPDAKRAGKGWSARCPAHEDRRASLSIGEGKDGRALVKCHAGCKHDAICAAVGLSVVDLMPTADAFPKPSKPSGNGRSRIIAHYDYRDEVGNLLFQAVRFEPKDFRQRQPRPDGGWNWSVKGVRVVPYRLPDLLKEPERPIVVVEGEKDADNLASIGVLATCNSGGAGKWTGQHAEFLRGRAVLIIPDNDDAGRNHAQQVAQTLNGVAKSVRIVELPGLHAKGDVSDWIAAGGTKEDLKRLVEATPVWTPDAEPWPEIASFDELDLPAFPTHVLPTALRDWVEAESHATQTPSDLTALLTLAVCAATIARRVVVQARTGWREPVNIFVAVLLEPGNRKSQVFADTLRPLRELEAEAIEAARPEIARQESARRQDEARLRKLEKRASDKGDSEARYEAGNLAAELAIQPEPALPRFIADDSTAEQLGIILEQQAGRIASMSPEGGVFDLMAGLYSKSGMPQFGVYLMGHSGDDLVTDRVGRKSVRVERPALTCAYTIQPAVIEGLAENVAFRGRGLLARFLYAAPSSWIGRREIDPEPVADTTREAYRHVVRSMAEVKGESVLQLTVHANSRLKEWEAEIEAMLAEGGQMEIMQDWGAKLAGATLRLAAVLHCAEHGVAGRISAETLTGAIEISRYLIPHAQAVLNMMSASEDSTAEDARYILRWIERHRRREFTKREAQQHGKRRFPKAEDIDPGLGELTRRGYIRLQATDGSRPGRPPSPTYDVNPTAFAASPSDKRSQYSQNSTIRPSAASSENIENSSKNVQNANRVQVTI